jgi:hypothetical protein
VGDDVVRDLIREVSDLRGDIRALTARIDERLDSGGKQIEDHEDRLRLLEQWRWKMAGGAAIAGALAGGGASALIEWAVSR